MLGEFCDQAAIQHDLFTDHTALAENDSLMCAIDKINQASRSKVWFAGQRPKEDWFMKRANLSPAYTTRWSDIPKVR